MAVAEGKDRRGLTLPLEIWEAIDTAAQMEHKTPADIVSDAIRHQCLVPVPTDLEQMTLDVRELQADMKALVGLLERRFLDGGTTEPVPVTAAVTPKQVLDDWYASNRVNGTGMAVEELLPEVRYADSPPARWWARLWQWLIYRSGRMV